MNHIDIRGEPLRVAHVVFGLNVGGLEKVMVEWARHSDPEHVDLHFISLTTRGELAQAIEEQGWSVTALGKLEGFRPELVWRLCELFRRLRPDVVHTHDAAPLIYGMPAASIAGVRRKIHTHHCRTFDHSRNERRLLRWIGRLPDWLVGVSKDTTQAMKNEGVPPAKITTIWNGIDTNRFAFTGPKPDGPIVTVARLSKEKDIGSLLQAMKLIGAKEPKVQLEIAGDGECRSELEALCRELELTDRVRFLGMIDDVPGLLARALLFVLPSLSEGISLTLLEASARGLPIVATRVGGNPEVVEEGVSGLLVPPSAPEPLADAILSLYQNKQQAMDMGRAGRRRVEEHFEIKKMITKYLQLYSKDKSDTLCRTDARDVCFSQRG